MRIGAYDDAFGDMPHMVCYAVKANSTLGVLSLLARAGCGLRHRFGRRVVPRVAGRRRSVARRILRRGQDCRRNRAGAAQPAFCNFNCESEAELAEIDAIAEKLGVTARFSLRVNPDVDAATHPYISTGLRDHKFGIDIARSCRRLRPRANASRNLRRGRRELPYRFADSGLFVRFWKPRARCWRWSKICGPTDIAIDHVDLGGGLGIAYQAAEIARRRSVISFGDPGARRARDGLTVMVEPGRSIVGPAGVLLTRVLYRKTDAIEGICGGGCRHERSDPARRFTARITKSCR